MIKRHCLHSNHVGKLIDFKNKLKVGQRLHLANSIPPELQWEVRHTRALGSSPYVYPRPMRLSARVGGYIISKVLACPGASSAFSS